LTGCQNQKSSVYNVGGEVATSSISPSDQMKNRLLQLEDDGIKEAIHIGESLTKSNSNDFSSKYLLPVLHNNISGKFSKELQPEVLFTTNYYKIVEKSFEKFQKFDKLSFEDAKRETNNLFMQFRLTTYGDGVTMAGRFYCVLKQGDIVIKPFNDRLIGADGLSSNSSNWPKFPAYTKQLVAMFTDIDELNFSEPAELIFLYDGKEESVTYDLDFSKYN
jgi:hypothetical protein